MADKRTRDPARTKQALLDAALAEFSEKGLAGARVADIAERAGVNKQLISYYFGGKRGLYDALVERWLGAEAEFAPKELPFDELVARYVADGVDHRDVLRLMIRESFDSSEVPWAPTHTGLHEADLADVKRRQREGELSRKLDAPMLLLAVQAAAAAGVAFPGNARGLTGLDPASPEFAERYSKALRAIVKRLAD
jgi:TetR/AcrR family transcriptional regulator